MKTMTQTNPIPITSSIEGAKKFDTFVFKPLRAGFKGFTITMMLLLVINLLSYAIGSEKTFGMDALDLGLAGLGFILQTLSSLFKNFAK
ncbi:MAG: hypothetical protein HXY50_01740 [Ignavibacteriaceae bacterium]|nr:hypothetical protein [Ignavibacteriaceae bacterium]